MAMLVWQTLKNFKNVEKLVFRWDPDKISLQDLFCAGYMLCEMVVREQETQVLTFRDENWLLHDHTIRLKNPETRIVRHWYLLRHSWGKRKSTFSDSRNREHHRRVGFWVQAPESDWAGGWQKYGGESCDTMLQMMEKRWCPEHKDLDELSVQASFFNVSFPLYMRQTHVLHAPRFQSVKLSFCKLWSFQGVQHGVQHVEAVPHTRGEGWGRLPFGQLGNTQVSVCVQQVDCNMCNIVKLSRWVFS